MQILYVLIHCRSNKKYFSNNVHTYINFNENTSELKTTILFAKSDNFFCSAGRSMR